MLCVVPALTINTLHLFIISLFELLRHIITRHIIITVSLGLSTTSHRLSTNSSKTVEFLNVNSK